MQPWGSGGGGGGAAAAGCGCAWVFPSAIARDAWVGEITFCVWNLARFPHMWPYGGCSEKFGLCRAAALGVFFFFFAAFSFLVRGKIVIEPVTRV